MEIHGGYFRNNGSGPTGKQQDFDLPMPDRSDSKISLKSHLPRDDTDDKDRITPIDAIEARADGNGRAAYYFYTDDDLEIYFSQDHSDQEDLFAASKTLKVSSNKALGLASSID